MVMFWDTSAVLPVLIREAGSAAVRTALEQTSRMAYWWMMPIECASALWRRVREHTLTVPECQAAFTKLKVVLQSADCIHPSDQIRERAMRVLAVHPLRAADATHLAAALIWAEEQPSGCGFVSLDARLCEAARKEQFDVLL